MGIGIDDVVLFLPSSSRVHLVLLHVPVTRVTDSRTVVPEGGNERNFGKPIHSYPIFAIAMYCRTCGRFACGILDRKLTGCLTYLYMVVKQHAYQDVAAKLFGHLHSLSMNYHLTKKTGKVLRCLDRGSTSTDNIVNVIFFRLLPTFIELVIVSIVFIFSFKEKILSVVTIIGVVLYVIITGMGTRIRLRFKKQTNEHDNQASEKAVDSLVNFETVKYFCTEDYELDRYMSSIFLYQKSQLSTRGLMNVIVVAQQLIQQTCLGVCLLISARNTYYGVMTVAVTVYITNIFKPLDSLGNIYNTIVQSFVDMENLVELLRIQPEVQDKPGAPALEASPTASAVSFHNISESASSQWPQGRELHRADWPDCGYRGLDRLRQDDYQSTAIPLLRRAVWQNFDQRTGHCVGATEISPPKHWHRAAGHSHVNDTIRYNLTYGHRHCSEEELIAAVKVANIYEFIMSLPNKLDSQIGERGLKLSGGEKQRIAIARLVLKNPSVVVLDEATSSLDTVTEKSIHQALNAACEGRTTIIIAHRLSTVRHANNIIVLEKGHIVETGSHAQLLEQGGRYLQLWTQQSRETEEGSNNMLYPSQDREIRRLVFRCRNCGQSEDVEENCIYVNELVKDTRVQLDVLPGDVIDDPTLQRDYDVACPNCGHNGAVFIRSQDGVKQSTLALIWVCLNRDCQVDEEGNRLPSYRWMGS
ncbi:P-loop containing nucleoside triphosphate hydrolase [Phytophthora cactorum]|nr:P-loop containing nucleoside triphosphate hydrolase [Phytophthora cactorum]